MSPFKPNYHQGRLEGFKPHTQGRLILLLQYPSGLAAAKSKYAQHRAGRGVGGKTMKK
jgi:hypothetical protein